MENKENFATANTILQDICNTRHLFCGILFVFGRDFAQTLLIIFWGNKIAQVNANISKSFFWSRFSILKLRRNIKICLNKANRLFAKQVSDISYHLCFYNTIELPPQIINCYHHIKKICKFIFPWVDLYYTFDNPDFF